MQTNSLSAGRAFPFYSFPADKLMDSSLFYFFKILNQTHIILCSVPGIYVGQPFTGIAFTFKAEGCIFILKKLTIFYFACSAGNGFILVATPAARAFVFYS
jgi:hypothetical protein